MSITMGKSMWPNLKDKRRRLSTLMMVELITQVPYQYYDTAKTEVIKLMSEYVPDKYFDDIKAQVIALVESIDRVKAFNRKGGE